MAKLLVSLGALSAGISVAAGAFGAHALKKRLDDYLLGVFETGARYQMYHALALILLGILAAYKPHPMWHSAGISMVIGTLLFSGSLYILALTGTKWLGAITPLGGLGFLIGWGMAAYAAFKVL